MRSFSARVLRVANAAAETLEPVSFQYRMDELTLEKLVAANPALMGEELLVLGRQLAEFEEDKDRLDILAVDTDGEIVLIELKVTEDFRVTDLQALAYAGAYAIRSTEELAHTLRGYQKKLGASGSAASHEAVADRAASPSTEAPARPPAALAGNGQSAGGVNTGHAPAPATHPPSTVTLDAAKDKIADFLQLDDFESWEHSQRVRIKLVAPNFPKRVLQNVKHLGDVYGMPIEAIAARLFQTRDGQLVVTFERLLPLPGEDEFDMTLRVREERKLADNMRRRQRPAVVPLLLEVGRVTTGQTLYLHKSVLPLSQRHVFDPAKLVFQVRLCASKGAPVRFEWHPDEDTPPEQFAPSSIAYKVNKAIYDYPGEPYSTAVATTFTVEPNGKTLADIALDEGVWSPVEAVE